MSMKICPKCGGVVFYDSYHHAYVCTRSDCDYWEPKKGFPTNADRIRSMSDYDLADWIAKVLMYHGRVQWHPHLNCDKNCPLYKCCNDQPSDNIEDWLKSPAD